MSCPSEQAWLIAELGDVTVNQRAALLKHAQGCAICTVARERQKRLISDLSAPPRLEGSTQAFLARVLDRSRQAGRQTPTSTASHVSRALLPGLTALSVAAALAFAYLPARDLGEVERVQARGGKAGRLAEHTKASAEVFLARGKTLTSLTDARLHAGDRLAVRVLNPSAEATFLLVFAIDARGEVHWQFPAYTDGATNPGSLVLAETHEPTMLTETVELEAPAPGPLRVVSIVSSKRTTVHEVEKLLAARRGEPLERVFSASSVREWKCTWSAP